MTELRIREVDFENGHIIVSFNDRRQMRISLKHFPRLKAGSVKQRRKWQLIGRGRGVHWSALDEDLSVENFLLAHSRLRLRKTSLAR